MILHRQGDKVFDTKQGHTYSRFLVEIIRSGKSKIVELI